MNSDILTRDPKQKLDRNHAILLRKRAYDSRSRRKVERLNGRFEGRIA